MFVILSAFGLFLLFYQRNSFLWLIMLQADSTEIASLNLSKKFYHLSTMTQRSAVAVLLFFLFLCFGLLFS